MSSTRKADPAIEAGAAEVLAVIMAELPVRERVTWHAATEDQRAVARLAFSAGLLAWCQAGGRL